MQSEMNIVNKKILLSHKRTKLHFTNNFTVIMHAVALLWQAETKGSRQTRNKLSLKFIRINILREPGT